MSTIVFTIGSDPELFVRKGEVISSVAGQLGCSKEDKLDLSNNVRLQEDNVLAEFDINPCTGFEEFNQNMADGINLVRQFLNTRGLDIAEGVSSHVYTADELKSFDKSAFIFGCTPDFNALTSLRNPSPTAADPGLRTAGGHVHIGFKEAVPANKNNQLTAGILCDYYHSLPSLFLDEDTRRKELYGKAGAIRFKDYGIEYRSLSNFWVMKEELRKIIYEQTEKVVKALVEDKIRELHSILPVDRLHSIINTNDRRTAESFMARLNII